MKHLIRCLVVLLFILSLHGKAHGQSLTIGWTASTSPDAFGYNVYYGTNSGNYSYKMDAGAATSLSVSNLIPGVTYYFNATAYDGNGDESPYSGEISFIVPGIMSMTSTVAPGSPATMQFPVAPGHWYEVQATTDLQNWTSIWQSDVMVSNFWASFTDPDTAAYTSRFYRLVSH